MKRLLTILPLLLIGCAATQVPYSFTRQTIPAFETTAIVRAMSELGYPIDFKDEAAGVVNTGWHDFNVQRGALKISYAMRSRALFVVKDGATQMQYECQASYGGAVGGQQWQPVNATDKNGIAVAEQERRRIMDALK